MSDLALKRGLPANLDAERFVLGSILLDDAAFPTVCETLRSFDFSLEVHRKLFARMSELYERGEHIDRVTLANELNTRGQLAGCGGLTYLCSLDEGLPQLSNLDSYVRIVQEKATLRRAILTSQKLIERCLMAGEDSGAILADAEAMLSQIGRREGKHGDWYTPGRVVETFPGGINAFLNPQSGGSGLPTGWAPVDRSICGMQAGDLIVVAGRPGMGKSACCGQIAGHLAGLGSVVALFSLEMTKESLVRRLLCGAARVDHQRYRTGRLDQQERARLLVAAQSLFPLPLHIDDTHARTMPAQLAAIRKLNAVAPVKLIIVDHLQLMKAVGRVEKRYLEMGEIVHSLKALAKEMKLPVILLSQLNRDCETENRRPQLSDLKETGDLEQDADIVLFVHRPERYAKNANKPELRGVAEFIIAKQRDGPIGTIQMLFIHQFLRFECRTEDQDPQPEQESFLDGV